MQGFFTGTWLGNQQVVQIHAQAGGILRVQCVFHVNECSQASGFLGLGDGRQGQGGFTGGFRSVDFHNAAAGKAAHTQSAVNQKVARGNDVHFHFDVVSKAHNGVFSEVFLDLGEGQVKVALAGCRQFFRFGG